MTRTTWIMGALLLLAATEAAADMRACARENEVCRFEGTREVHYGAGDKWLRKVFTGPIRCDNATFGSDPVQGKAKTCRVSTTVKEDPGALPRVTSAWPKCGSEGGTCAFQGQKRVAYGTDGKYRQRLATNGVKCTNEAFGGDPYPGRAKSCFLMP